MSLSGVIIAEISLLFAFIFSKSTIYFLKNLIFFLFLIFFAEVFKYFFGTSFLN